MDLDVEALKAKLAAAQRAQDAEHAAKIAAELREMIDKASAELFRLAGRLADADGSSGRTRPAPVVAWLA